MEKRIGVLGGTFNPIHLGHLHIAGEIKRLFSLDQVHFVVAATPPHKNPGDLIPFVHRYTMVGLATAETPFYIPSMIELEPQASPYSIDTMAKLARRVPEKLFFIAGGDSLAEVHTWKKSEKLLATYNFIFAMRPGTGPVAPSNVLPAAALPRVRDWTGSKHRVTRRVFAGERDSNHIYIVNVGAPNISATRIRSLVSAGKPISRLVPGPVRDYIRKLHLYGGR